MEKLPVIDIQPLFDAPASSQAQAVARDIGRACRHTGFFYVSAHRVDEALQEKLEQLSRAFFALPAAEKMRIAMHRGGKAWRGYFPLEGELTSGMPDLKEGIYFGQELPADDRRVQSGLPLHGANLFPEQPEALRQTVLQYMDAVTQAAHAILRGIALSLHLDADYFHRHYTADPLILFRIFHYPSPGANNTQWGVGEHTDYGLLTILKQDATGGLQVKSNNAWMDAPPLPGTFVCNIGDMLDRITGGLYRSTPHRVLNTSGKSRCSFPLFFDPAFEARVRRIDNIPPAATRDDRDERWDKESVHLFDGSYGEYLLRKVGKVFPQLRQDVL